MNIDHSNCVIEVGVDFFSWPTTSIISKITLQPSAVCVDHSKQQVWPAHSIGGTLEYGSLWVFAKLSDDKWHCAANRLRPYPANQCKPVPDIYKIGIEFVGKSDIPISSYPLTGWTPKTDELVGFMVATPARYESPTPHERSPIVFVKWAMGICPIVDIEGWDPNPNPDPNPVPSPNDQIKAQIDIIVGALNTIKGLI